MYVVIWSKSEIKGLSLKKKVAEEAVLFN